MILNNFFKDCPWIFLVFRIFKLCETACFGAACLALLAWKSSFRGKICLSPGPGCMYPGNADTQNIFGTRKSNLGKLDTKTLSYENDMPMRVPLCSHSRSWPCCHVWKETITRLGEETCLFDINKEKKIRTFSLKTQLVLWIETWTKFCLPFGI